MVKKILICSAWPYCQTVPHLGNLIGSLLSGDVVARYYRLREYDTLYISGTDAYGTRVEFEAERLGITPEELVKKNHAKILKILKGFNIKFDNYSITTSNTHKDFVRKLFKKIEKNGFIITKTEKRAFCKNCNRFLADSFIIGKCPRCGYGVAKGNQCDSCGELLEPEELISPRCAFCGKKDIIFRETKHWYLDLKKLEPKLKKYVSTHNEWTDNVKNLTRNFLKVGLKARAITRDIEWGIPAPFKDAKGKVIYVWAEAALGYVSATKESTKNWKDFWFGNEVRQIYTIGKDNIPFHTLFFPAELIASGEGYHLPDSIFATEYLNWEDGKKFSKSRGVGLYTDDALKKLSAPYWRFYLLYNRPERGDVNFSWRELEKSINQVLIGDYINFVNRTLVLVNKLYGSKVPSPELKSEDKRILEKIRIVKKNVEKHFEEGGLNLALKEIFTLCRAANIYFQRREPWKTKDATVLYVALEIIKGVSILLYPFIPSVSERIWNLLNFKELKWSDIDVKIKVGSDVKKAKNILNKINIDKVKA